MQRQRELPENEHWVAAWSSAQQIPDPENALRPEQYQNRTLRQVLRTALGGTRLRVRLSNLFGDAPLLMAGASIARSLGAGSADIDASSSVPLTFGGERRIWLPAAAEYTSDPIVFTQAAQSDLAISLHLLEAPARQTSHPGSRTTSFVLEGEHLAAATMPGAERVEHWYHLADVEVLAPRDVGVLAATGDSITDGRGSTTDGNDRWTDRLVQRLAREHTQPFGVINTALGGNRLLRDRVGPNLVSRFERDVLARSGVTHALLLIGVNDLGNRSELGRDASARARLLSDLQFALSQLIARAREQGVRMIGATVMPYGGNELYRPDADDEADRLALNAWIRGPAGFDAVADFDAAMRDPAAPDRLRAEFHCGDFLHPTPAGFVAMAAAVPLQALDR